MSKTYLGTPPILGALAPMILVTLLCAALAAAQTQNPASGGSSMLSLHTAAFETGSQIPDRYTCSGADVSPALTWDGAPQGTQSFALITDDPDAPNGTFTHWVMFDIPPESKGLAQNVPKTQRLDDGALQGRNDFHRDGYGGPCPPPGKTHRYYFKLYALDSKLSLDPGATRQQLEAAMKGHVLAQAELMGTFKR